MKRVIPAASAAQLLPRRMLTATVIAVVQERCRRRAVTGDGWRIAGPENAGHRKIREHDPVALSVFLRPAAVFYVVASPGFDV